VGKQNMLLFFRENDVLQKHIKQHILAIVKDNLVTQRE
jgi:hypothetical protein